MKSRIIRDINQRRNRLLIASPQNHHPQLDPLAAHGGLHLKAGSPQGVVLHPQQNPLQVGGQNDLDLDQSQSKVHGPMTLQWILISF